MVVVISCSTGSAANNIISDVMDLIAVLVSNEGLGSPGIGSDDDRVFADHSANSGSGLNEVLLDLFSGHNGVISGLIFEVESRLVELMGVV